MQVRVHMNNADIRRLSRAQITALEKTAEAVKTDVIAKGVIPFDSGHMQNDSTTIDIQKAGQGKVSISVNTPYARRLYYHPEYKFQTDNNPNAKGKWFDDWISGNRKAFVKNAYKEFYRRETGV